MDSCFAQASYGVRLDWGAAGAQRLATPAGCVVIVDVLSFSTAVTIATAAGTAVYPYRAGDDSAVAFAHEHDARLAVSRAQVSAEAPWSLSPATLVNAPFTPRLVLPSPNGSAIAAAVQNSGARVIAGCLRNTHAVADWLTQQGYGTPQHPAVVIAAGEHWPDGALRPALEDFLGAGAIIIALINQKPTASVSPEAHAAACCYQALPDIASTIAHCVSGRELHHAGYSNDVTIASQLNASPVVPILHDGSFSTTP